jgi:hypothetical protein
MLAGNANQFAMRLVQCPHRRDKHATFAFCLRLHGDDGGENFHATSITQMPARREWRNSADARSNQENKNASDHQREHPDEIDVEPSAPQYTNTELFVNQHR